MGFDDNRLLAHAALFCKDAIQMSNLHVDKEKSNQNRQDLSVLLVPHPDFNAFLLHVLVLFQSWKYFTKQLAVHIL